MSQLYRCIVFLSFIVLLHGKRKDKHNHPDFTQKHKRDLADLNNDLLLSSVFKSDIKEKRHDRSISISDEPVKSKPVHSNAEEVNGGLFPKEDIYRRNADTNDLYVATDSTPIIGNEIPIPSVNMAAFRAPLPVQNVPAVNPALFAGNYMPLEGSQQMEPQARQAIVSKRSSISALPQPVRLIANKYGGLSAPLQLRKFSPNAGLRGIVPHVAEYGETVESVERAQKGMNFKRSMVPKLTGMEHGFQHFSQSMYSPEVFKKNSIPGVPEEDESMHKVKKTVIPKAVPEAAPRAVTEVEVPAKVSKDDGEAKRRGELDSQVQNLDGAFTRPIISKEKCSDMYKSCTDMAKTDYCTKYFNLMKIQCRRSCGFCDPNVDNAPKTVLARSHTKEGKSTVTGDSKTTDSSTKVVKHPKGVIHHSRKVELASPAAKQNDTDSAEDATAKKSNIDEGSGGSTSEKDVIEAGSDELASGSGSASESGSGSASGQEPVFIMKSKIAKAEISSLKATGTASSDTEESAVATTKSELTKDDKSIHEEFTLPVIKSQVSTALLLNDEAAEAAEESGSGSASGDTAADDDPVKKDEITSEKKPKEKASVKKHVIEAKSEKKSKIKKNDSAHKKDSKNGTKRSKTSVKPASSGKKHKKDKVIKTKKEKPIVSKKRSNIPAVPVKPAVSYPKIDLKLIAKALARYEQAALELAGEYPKSSSLDMTEYQRSLIPHPPQAPQYARKDDNNIRTIFNNNNHNNKKQLIPYSPVADFSFAPFQQKQRKTVVVNPLDKYKQNLEIAKFVTDNRNGRSVIPKFLKLSKDVKPGEKGEENNKAADSLSSIQKRFNILGVEPTLIDYYAETGKINPFSAKSVSKGKNVKKNRVSSDPYEYLRNMPIGASMMPIDDPKARSRIPSDHSSPVFLMKVSPGETKYIDEASHRGSIRRLNAEGLLIQPKTEESARTKATIANTIVGTTYPGNMASPNMFSQTPKRTQPWNFPGAPVFPQNGIPASLHVPDVPVISDARLISKYTPHIMPYIPAAATARYNVKLPSKIPHLAVASIVPHRGAPNVLQTHAAAAAAAIEKSAIQNGMSYAKNQMRMNKNAVVRSHITNRNLLGRPAPRPNFVGSSVPFMAAEPKSTIKSAFDIARATSPYINPLLAARPAVRQLDQSRKSQVVSAFFPTKKDEIGMEGSGEVLHG